MGPTSRSVREIGPEPLDCNPSDTHTPTGALSWDDTRVQLPFILLRATDQ